MEGDSCRTSLRGERPRLAEGNGLFDQEPGHTREGPPFRIGEADHFFAKFAEADERAGPEPLLVSLCRALHACMYTSADITCQGDLYVKAFALVTRRQPRETHLRNVWSARFTDEESDALDRLIAQERLSSAADVIRLLIIPELTRRGLIRSESPPRPAETPPRLAEVPESTPPHVRGKSR